jgi:hypothetical protein
MGNRTSQTLKTDKVTLKYKKHRSRPFYVANVIYGKKVIKKKFKTREEASNWIVFVREKIDQGEGETIVKMIGSYT